MNEQASTEELARLRAELSETRAMAQASLKAAIAALSGLDALVQGLWMNHMIGEVPELSLHQAEEHLKRGLATLRAVVEEPDLGR